MSDHAGTWRKLTTRWARGRRLVLLHLLLTPALIYLISLPVSWAIKDDPVWYLIVAFVIWLLVFVYLLVRDRSQVPRVWNIG